jgi:formylglycine-generating enzyme required for sulfatase activity
MIRYSGAVAYARWAGTRLPAEAAWEYAAGAGKQYDQYYRGNRFNVKKICVVK